MEAGDVLANDVHVRRPPLLEGARVGREPRPGDVVGERVEPDVDAMVRIAGEGNAPAGPGAAHREVAQALAQPGEDLVAEVLRLAEARVLGVQALERLLVSAQPEEVVLLLQPLQLEGRVIRAVAVDQLRLGLELVVAWAIPAGVRALVDVASRLRAADHLEGCLDMVGIRGADEAVVADLEAVEGGPPVRGPLVHERPRIRPVLTRERLDLRRVLVHAGQEARFVAEQALVTGQGIGSHGLEERVQGRRSARVEDRGGEVVTVLGRAPCRPGHGSASSSASSSSSASVTAAPAPTATPCVRPFGQ